MPVVFFVTDQLSKWSDIPNVDYYDLMQVKLPRMCLVKDIPSECLTEDEAKRLVSWGDSYGSTCGVIIFNPCINAFTHVLQPPCNPRYLTGEE
jgi:hypothetical protein